REREPHGVDIDLTSLNPGEVQEIVDEPGHPSDVGLDTRERRSLAWTQVADNAFEQTISEPLDRSEWGAKLVGDIRDELGLQAIELLELRIRRLQLKGTGDDLRLQGLGMLLDLFIELGVLDRNGRVIRQGT